MKDSDLQTVIAAIDAQLSGARQERKNIVTQVTKEQELLQKYVLLEIGPLNLAIALSNLAEVGPLPEVTFLPNLPVWIQGIVNLRSEIVSVIDFARFLKIEATGENKGKRLAVLLYKRRKVGLRVDRIVSTISRGPSQIFGLPRTDEQVLDTSFFSGEIVFEKRHYFVLNSSRLLTTPRLINYNRAEE